MHEIAILAVEDIIVNFSVFIESGVVEEVYDDFIKRISETEVYIVHVRIGV